MQQIFRQPELQDKFSFSEEFFSLKNSQCKKQIKKWGEKYVQHNIFNIYPNLYPLTTKLGYINLHVVCDKRALVSFAPTVPYITYTFIQQIFPANGCSTASDIWTEPKLKWNNNCCGHWGAKGRVYCGFQEHSYQSQSFLIYPCQVILI